MRRILREYHEARDSIIEKDPPFPEFIRSLRQALGFKLHVASKYLKISRHKLSRLELGKAVEVPHDLQLPLIAELYEAPEWLVQKKFYEYIGSQQRITRCRKKNPCGTTKPSETEEKK